MDVRNVNGHNLNAHAVRVNFVYAHALKNNTVNAHAVCGTALFYTGRKRNLTVDLSKEKT
jgi:hypothetical protein